MKKFLALVLPWFFITMLVACNGAEGIPRETVTGSGRPQTQEVNISGFSKVIVDDRFEATIAPGDTANSFQVQITIDDNLISYLDVTKSGDLLNVGLKHNVTYLQTTCKAQLKLPALRQLEVKGAARAQVRGFSTANPMDFNISGAGALVLAGVKSGNASFNASGAGKVTTESGFHTADLKIVISGGANLDLEGSGEDLSLDSSGGSKFDLSDFSVSNANITVSGGSQGELNVSGKLDANISGASRVVYRGNPTLGKTSVSAGASLNKK